MLETKTAESMAQLFEDAGVQDALEKLNQALAQAGHDYQIKSVVIEEQKDTPDKPNKPEDPKPDPKPKPKPCKCLRWGIIGYDEHCYIINGQKQCTKKYIYGCQLVDCT